jgi:hypothetical protein
LARFAASAVFASSGEFLFGTPPVGRVDACAKQKKLVCISAWQPREAPLDPAFVTGRVVHRATRGSRSSASDACRNRSSISTFHGG